MSNWNENKNLNITIFWTVVSLIQNSYSKYVKSHPYLIANVIVSCSVQLHFNCTWSLLIYRYLIPVFPVVCAGCYPERKAGPRDPGVPGTHKTGSSVQPENSQNQDETLVSLGFVHRSWSRAVIVASRGECPVLWQLGLVKQDETFHLVLPFTHQGVCVTLQYLLK